LNPNNPESEESKEAAPREEKLAETGNGGIKGTRWGRFGGAIILVFCLSLFAFKAVTSLVQESATYDETTYFGMGKYLLQNQRWDVPGSILHPPLSFYISSLPLVFFPTDAQAWQSDPSRVKDPEYLGAGDMLRGQTLLASPANRGDRLLDWSRIMVVLTAVLLGWFVYRLSDAFYGRRSAILAVVLFSFSPDMLAHARLITPDMTLTTFSCATIFYLWRFLKTERLGDVVLGGIFLGLTLLSKFTGLLVLAGCFGLMALWKQQQKKLNPRHVLLFVMIGFGILCLGYGFDPEPYFLGIFYQHAHAGGGHYGFLLGDYSSSGWWYYFIVAFLLKTPIPLLLFLAVAAYLWVRNWRGGYWLNETFLLIPAAVIFLFFSVNRDAIGVRYILPAYPFLFVFASKAAQICFTNKWRMGLSAAALAWYVGASCFIHPHYLAYFNELAGGPGNGYKRLVDSNLDWGQDLKGLKKFMDANGIAKISLSYFGSDSPARYGIAYDWLPSYSLDDPRPDQHEKVLKGWVAISATNLEGDYFENKDLFAWFRQREPVAKIGYSIFVYKVDD
jgi:4-amino-4-deoxy-L-arabinose transferase-like glycosyltransferase